MKNSKKRIIVTAIAILTFSSVFTNNSDFCVISNDTMKIAAADTGIGSGLSWTLTNSNKTLTITGDGTMNDFYSMSSVPWRSKASSITKVVFSGSVTNIGAYAFANCSNLKAIVIPKSVKTIGKFAFYNSGLVKADFTDATRVIDETAFENTPFFRNNYTAATLAKQNIGAAKTLNGRQVVVNIFVNEIEGQTSEWKQISTSDKVDSSSEYVVFNYTNDIRTQYKYYKVSKSAVKRAFASSFGSGTDIVSSNQFKSNYAKSLDDYKYYKKNSYSSLSEIQRNYTGEFVTSSQINETLNTVESALTEIKNQALNYGKNVEFITNCDDTNLYFTYDRWNVNKSDNNFGNPNQSIKDALIIGNDQSAYSSNINTMESYFFQQLNDKMDKSIVIDNNRKTSEYTEYLKNKYNANGVVYLFHYNTNPPEARTLEGIAFPSTDLSKNSTDECCKIFQENKHTIMHEILHLYGALDYYPTNGQTINENSFFAYTYSYNRNDVMMNTSNYLIGADTAYCIGLSNKIMKDTYNLFNNKDNPYAMGDVNMDGIINSSDSSLTNTYNRYSSNPTEQTILSPVQKVLGKIVTPR